MFGQFGFHLTCDSRARGWLWAIILVWCSEITHGINTPPVEDFLDQLGEKVPEGKVSQITFDEVIYRLNDESGCSEAKILLKDLVLSHSTIERLLEESCAQETSEPEKSATRFGGRILQKMNPKSTDYPPAQFGFNFENQTFSGGARGKANAVDRRFVKWNSSQWLIEAGQSVPSRHLQLPWVLGRNHYSGYQPVSTVSGLIHPAGSGLNHVSVFNQSTNGLFGGTFAHNLAAYSAQKLSVTHSSAGAKQEFNDFIISNQFAVIQVNSTTNRFKEKYGIFGGELNLPGFNSSIGYGTSVASRNEKYDGTGFYGRIDFDINKNSKANLYQSSSLWTNPAMTAGYREFYREQEGLWKTRGGEGGLILNNSQKFPGVKNVKLKSWIDYKWNPYFPDFQYAHYQWMLNQHQKINWSVGQKWTAYEQKEYGVLFCSIGKTFKQINAKIKYELKSGKYSGAYPHPLELNASWKYSVTNNRISKTSRLRIILPDLENPQNGFLVYLYQGMKLTNRIHFRNSLRLPIQKHIGENDLRIEFGFIIR